MKPVTWGSINRHRFFDEAKLNKLQATYTVNDLRKMLKGWTWQRVIENTLSMHHVDGVYFHGRVGRFLNRPAIAVCALEQIVVLRYLAVDNHVWVYSLVIDGSRHGGFVLVIGDFTGHRLGDIQLTDPIVKDEEL